MPRRRFWIAVVLLLGCSGVVSAWLLPTGRDSSPPAFAAARPDEELTVTTSQRDALLSRMKVWRQRDRTPIDFAANPPDPSGLLSEPIVRCQYRPHRANGTTAKFDCVLADGEVIKVKYGHTGEIHAEIAASRLLAALGFGADRMYLVPRVRCYGCVRTPFYTMWLLDKVHVREAVTRTLPEDRYTDFEWAAIERPVPGVEIETDEVSGWGWWELDRVDPSRGASRAELDALRLAAMLIVHWDNKSANQRLVCPPGTGSTLAACSQPFGFIQDLGASFGPNKMDLDHWAQVPIWADAARCLVSMRPLPYEGGTFPDVRISEEGRQLLARELAPLTDDQIASLFTAARFHEFNGWGTDGDVRAWTRTFRDKVRQITERGPCPSSSTLEAQSARSSETSPAPR